MSRLILGIAPNARTGVDFHPVTQYFRRCDFKADRDGFESIKRFFSACVDEERRETQTGRTSNWSGTGANREKFSLLSLQRLPGAHIELASLSQPAYETK